MAYSFGGGVRPELGRTDFTPFLQGSVQGAQMQARGAENMAKGVASAGDSLAQGVKTYFANKAMVGEQMGKVEGALNTYGPRLLENATDETKKLFEKAQKNGTLSLAEASRLGAYIDSFQKSAMVDAQVDAQREATARKAMELVRQQQQNQAVVTAVSLNTNPDGKVDWRGIPATLAELGVDPLEVAPRLKSMQDMTQEQFEASVQQLDVPGRGSPVTAVATSRGGVQVLPDKPDPNDLLTAEQKNLDFRTERFARLPVLIKEGKGAEALALAQALNMRDEFGRPINMRSLLEAFEDGAPAVTDTPSSQPLTFATIEDAQAANPPKGTKVIINGRTATVQ
jgi:hypothetical protein